MSSIRGSAEIYYNGTGANSYGTAGTGTGVCADADVAKLTTAADGQTGNTATCKVGLLGASYVAYETLLGSASGHAFCVDSTGFAGDVATAGIVGVTSAAVSCK